MNNELSPFEQGMLMAITSIAVALRNSPGFDSEALTKAARFFIENPAQGCEEGEALNAYKWPLVVLQGDLSQLQNALNDDKTRN